MTRTSKLLMTSLALASLLAACSSTDSTNESANSAAAGSSSTTASTSGGDAGSSSASVKDACAALPAETIQSITGKDPGEGELETAGSSTVCRYYGDATLVVEIDPGSDLTSAQTSEEAYGNACESISDIGEAALFCSGFQGPGYIGEIIWTDGDHVFFVQYDEGDVTPTKDIPLQLAQALAA